MNGLSAPNPSTALARVVIDELARGGVSHVVLAPGSRSAALALAAVEHPEIELAVVIDERSAGFHALGIGRVTGSPAAVVTTSGTAAANLFPAIVEADTGCVPLIVVTADRPPELRHVGANQTIDQVKLFGSYPRWFGEITVPEDRPGVVRFWRSTVSRAIAEALGAGGAGGPVHLDIGFREPVVPVSDDGRQAADPFTSDLGGRPDGAPWTALLTAGPHALADPEELGERVVLWAGSEVDGAVVDRSWVVVAEPVARKKGTVTTAHHLLAHDGFADRFGPDTVVTLGRPGLSRPASLALARAPRRIAVDPFAWSDPHRDVSELRRFLPVPAGGDARWKTAWMEADAAVRSALDAALDAVDGPSEPRAARDVVRAIPRGGVLVVGSSMPVRDLDAYMPPAEVTVISNRGASGIDGFVSTALGVAATAGRPVVALCGDLSLLHDANGFLVDPRPSCVFVVVNNDGGGIFSFLPPAAFPESFERVFGTPHGRSLERLAALYDLSYQRVSHPSTLGDLVASGLEAGGVWLLEIRTDRTANVAAHRVLDAVAAATLDAFLTGSSPRGR